VPETAAAAQPLLLHVARQTGMREGQLAALHGAEGRGIPRGALQIAAETEGRATHREHARPGAVREEAGRGRAGEVDVGVRKAGGHDGHHEHGAECQLRQSHRVLPVAHGTRTILTLERPPPPTTQAV
jgi:hypothetical protein